MIDARDKAMKLIEDGLVSPSDMVKMALVYMSLDEVQDMLVINDLSDEVNDKEILNKWSNYEPE